MYLPIKPHRTCASAWLEAASAVNAAHGHEAYNVIMDIAEPLIETTIDRKIMDLVDSLLINHGEIPLQSVANTIFPQALYRRYGAPQFIELFNDKLLPKLRRNDRWTGYYFERMTRYPTRDSKPLNPLWDIVERIKDKKNKSRNKFEVTLFDPERDLDNSPYGGQCLSFLSFKIIHSPEESLALTAQYRNHYYIKKLLGNLIGLGRLMAFIAAEAQIGVGPLTILSTHACVDTPKGCGRTDINALLHKCRLLIQASQAA